MMIMMMMEGYDSANVLCDFVDVVETVEEMQNEVEGEGDEMEVEVERE